MLYKEQVMAVLAQLPLHNRTTRNMGILAPGQSQRDSYLGVLSTDDLHV